MKYSDGLRMESQKLMFHPDRVRDWLKGKNIYPVYLEIGSSGACNLRCIFCAFDYLKYKKHFLETKRFLKNLKELSRLGIKSILYSGEGEPLLHPEIDKLINYTQSVGIDTALSTNAVLLDKELSQKILPSLSWLRISLNAGTDSSYAKIHRAPPGTFNRVIDNTREAIRVKKKEKLAVTIGVQFILLKENYEDIIKLTRILKNIGLDYFSVKPYIQHKFSYCQIKNSFSQKEFTQLEEELENFSSQKFAIIFRHWGMEKLNQPRPYLKCLGLPFFAKIISDGGVYTCGPYTGLKDFCYGNIYKNTFQKIWEGKRRKEILKKVKNKVDVNKDCMANCRLDEINRFLWELTHPHPHINFI